MKKRANKPPIRYHLDFRFIDLERFIKDDKRPHTREFALQRKTRVIQDPSDRSARDPHWDESGYIIESQAHTLGAPEAWKQQAWERSSLSGNDGLRAIFNNKDKEHDSFCMFCKCQGI